nr:silencing boundary-establishment protein fub1-like protein [Quercus suber]
MASDPEIGNVLSSSDLSRTMVLSLPKDVSPALKSAHDAVALATHACMLNVGFRLIGLGEEHKIEVETAGTQQQPLPTEWNANQGHYAFRYAHTQSSMEYLLKVNRMGRKAVIMGMGLGDDKTSTFDVVVQEYISESKLPATIHDGDATEREAITKMSDVFITAGRLSDLAKLMRLRLIQKLAPKLHKEGYEETQETPSANTGPVREPAPGGEPDRPMRDPLHDDRNDPSRLFPLADPLAHPRRQMPEPMPGFEDEHGIMRPPHGLPTGGFPRYGDRDLYPAGLGPNDPLRGGIGPGFPSGGGGGGMHPSFDDPLFAGQGQRGSGYDPQAPPGSRYDPVGPGMGGHPRGAGMGGRPPNPFGGFGGGDFI